MSQKIFLIAGEHSGDVLGAGLIKALKEREPEYEFSGIGGPLMEKQGFQSLISMEELGVMGIWEVVGQLPRLLRVMEAVVFEIEKFKPDIVVTIDLPDFNFLIGKRLKKRGKSHARIVHYAAPSVWAWRPGRAKKIAQFLDGIMCLFPHEPPYFTKHRLKAEFVGHPLTEYDPGLANGPSFRKKFEIPEDATVLAVFLGSREKELNVHAAIFKEAITIVLEQQPNLVVIFPTLPYLEYQVMKTIQGVKYPAFVLVNPDEKWDEFAACDAALAVSGTVGLELAYMGVPHVIAYRMHPFSWLMVKILVKTKFAHLANILLDEAVVPEFLQGRCNSLDIAKGVLKIIKDDNERRWQIAKTAQVREMLVGEAGKTPSQRAADFVLEALKTPAKKFGKKSPKLPKKAAPPAKKKKAV
ncbi:MAG: lipid-A-disaccharide synthase [Alphaproteobacteria bacterium]